VRLAKLRQNNFGTIFFSSQFGFFFADVFLLPLVVIASANEPVANLTSKKI
jgi:hypothetical protein